MPQRREDADARILDEDCRLIAVFLGEERADLVRELLDERGVRRCEVDLIPRAAELAQYALVEIENGFRLPEARRIVIDVRRRAIPRAERLRRD